MLSLRWEGVVVDHRVKTMATAYHLEALRRQRVIDRTVEAKRRLEQVSVTRNAYADVAGDFSSIVVHASYIPFHTFRRICKRRKQRQIVHLADKRIVQKVHLLMAVGSWSAGSVRDRTVRSPSSHRLRPPGLGQQSHKSTHAMVVPVVHGQLLQHLSNTLEGRVPPLLAAGNRKRVLARLGLN